MLTRLILLAALLLPALPVHADAASSDLDYDARCRWMLELFRDKPIRGHQKTGLPDAVARLALSDGRDEEARRYLVSYPVKSDEFFDYPWIAVAMHRWGHRFSEDELTKLRGNLGKVRDWLNHGTENHAAMRVASGYLLAQYFPDMTWRANDRELTSEQLMAEAKAKLIARGRGFYRIGNNEQLSPSYAFLNAYPLLAVYDFAKDPQMKRIADALLTYHAATVAANNFDGHLMPPQNRRARQMRWVEESHLSYRFTAIHHTISWLLWNQNVVYPFDFTRAGEPPFAIFFALSSWRVPEVINRVARGEGAPYELRSQLSQFNEWGSAKGAETWRYLYRDPKFAIGAPVAQRFHPRNFFLDYDMFSIVWDSEHDYRVLEAVHPYWRSNKGPNERSELHSPFQQFAAHRHAAIVLYNIPDADPWAGEGWERYWVNQRNEHADNLIKLGQVRFPRTVQDLTVEGDWYFFRDGEVYLAVRALRAGHTLDRESVKGFFAINSQHARTGFIFEVGTKKSHDTFDAFRKDMLDQPVTVDWDKLEARYTTTAGDTLELQYNPSLDRKEDGSLMLSPSVRINGKAVELDTWPIFDSPVVKLADSVLTVRDGKDSLQIDWSGDLPKLDR